LSVKVVVLTSENGQVANFQELSKAKFKAALRTWEILWRYRDKGPIAQNSESINGTEGSHKDRA
jgi:hypothetical protein